MHPISILVGKRLPDEPFDDSYGDWMNSYNIYHLYFSWTSFLLLYLILVVINYHLLINGQLKTLLIKLGNLVHLNKYESLNYKWRLHQKEKSGALIILYNNIYQNDYLLLYSNIQNTIYITTIFTSYPTTPPYTGTCVSQ